MTPPAITRRQAIALALGAPGLAAPRLARGEAAGWPGQVVHFINLYAPGGANDILSRAWCQAMAQLTGQQFVVENRTGAGGTVGSDAIAKSRPDGTTVGLGGVANLAIAPSLFPSLPYDPARDYSFISGLYRQPNILIVNNAVPARSVPELIALLKANPGRYNYATGGAGTTPHLTAELFKTRTGTEMPFVQYRGGAPALIDLMAGQVQVLFDNIAGPIGAVRDGKVRALAVASLERSPMLPDLPTLAEFLPGFELSSWNGLIAPAGLPPALVQRMAELSLKALASPELTRVYMENGATPWLIGAEEFATYARSQEPKMRELVRISGAAAG
ncbi:Bug family tripartite tricarboxylate transporter substrate binding protein [Roseicella frigidaeris]|nr:tripartite tricarboxylate transporter substrate binding protein [Roseicella frigidaeris]